MRMNVGKEKEKKEGKRRRRERGIRGTCSLICAGVSLTTGSGACSCFFSIIFICIKKKKVNIKEHNKIFF